MLDASAPGSQPRRLEIGSEAPLEALWASVEWLAGLL